jgi:integrase
MIAPMVKPLYIPASKKHTGLKVYCYRCKTLVDQNCKETGKPITECKYGKEHRFKAIIHQPGTKNSRKTKTLSTRNIDEAIDAVKIFGKEVKGDDIELNLRIKEKIINQKDQRPQRLIHAMARFSGWLRNESVPMHRQKLRSKAHISDIERAFKTLVKCLKNSGYDCANLSVADIDDKMVGEIYEYLIFIKKFSNRSFNKYFSYYTSFLKWYSEEYDYPIRNWFERVKRKRINYNPQSIDKKEFEALLKLITPANSIKKYSQGVKDHRNVYRPWLKDGFRLALQTGRRREEITNLKFDQIKDDENGNSFIKIQDYKVNRIQNRLTDDEKKFVLVPVTNSLRELLNELGFQKYKGSNNYILAPESKIDRKRIMPDLLSRAFAHYYQQLGTGKKLSFKALRKTYITGLAIYLGENSARLITQHSGNKVIKEHYLDQQVLAKAASGFEVFPTVETRKSELDQLRNNIKNKKKVELNHEK